MNRKSFFFWGMGLLVLLCLIWFGGPQLSRFAWENYKKRNRQKWRIC